jgi:deazaflavin-dependent oxidoreductase (nitroreductase family)
VPVSRLAPLFARISPYLAHRPGSAWATQAHGWIVRRTGGRIGGRALGGDILVLRTTGRRTGRVRDAPLLFVTHADGFAVVASNAASARPPAWWFNLRDLPDAEMVLRGRTHPIRARAATAQERAELWPRLVALYGGYAHYESIATRELPIVILEPR